MTGGATVYVVDDDGALRESLSALIGSRGLEVRTFATADEFLAQPRTSRPACLVLDLILPGLSGLELQQRLAAEEDAPPIIFLTGHADVSTSVRAMKAGAVEFLPKPFVPGELLRAIEEALGRDRASRARHAEHADVRAQFGSLSAREREVAHRVIRGMLNKQIAAELGISEITVKVHRRRVMHKLRLRSVQELVRAASRAGFVEA